MPFINQLVALTKTSVRCCPAIWSLNSKIRQLLLIISINWWTCAWAWISTYRTEIVIHIQICTVSFYFIIGVCALLEPFQYRKYGKIIANHKNPSKQCLDCLIIFFPCDPIHTHFTHIHTHTQAALVLRRWKSDWH